MTIITQLDPPIARIQLNSPNTLNALTLNMGKIVQSTLQKIEHTPEVKAVILESSVAKAFSTGIDLKEFYTNNTQDYRKDFLAAWTSIAQCSKPIICAVHGYVYGGGLEIALMCDILVAADNAVFSQPELSVGTTPGIGATQRLSRRIGFYRASEMILTGRRVDAQTAETWGLVSQIAPLERFKQAVDDVAGVVASKSLPLLQKAKAAIKVSEEESLKEGLEQEKSIFLSTFELADQHEGFQAFLQKRPPKFRDS